MTYQSPGVPLQLVPTYSYAHWIQRVGALLIDQLLAVVAVIPALVGGVLIGVGSTITHHTTVDGSDVIDHWSLNGTAYAGIVLVVVGVVVTIAFSLWNIVFRQGRTGASLGKSALGLRLVKEMTGQPVGAGMTFVRQLCHLLDSAACYLGYLWPLWDDKRQTFADKCVSSVVINAR